MYFLKMFWHIIPQIGESRENDGLMDVRCDSEEQNIKKGGVQSFECGRGVRCGETWKTKMVRTSGA